LKAPDPRTEVKNSFVISIARIKGTRYEKILVGFNKGGCYLIGRVTLKLKEEF
jgi:hypothetical protein